MNAPRPGRLPLAWIWAMWLVWCSALGTAGAQDSDGDGLSDEEERAAGTSVIHPDTDGDGLLDGWEVHGYSYAGAFEPLAAYGADPLRKDVFVEIDWMMSAGENSQSGAVIAYQAAADILRVFRGAGVDIRIHFDLGPRIESFVPAGLLEPDIDVAEFQVSPDEHKVLPYQACFSGRPVPGITTSDLSLYDVYYGGFYFRPSRRNIFYYVVLAEQGQVTRDDTDPLEPLSRSHPYSDGFCDDLARRDGLRSAGVHVGVVFRKPVPDLSPLLVRYRYSVSFLHELGHAFGLGHGGSLPGYRWDNTNFKPNYPSIMNYRYQLWGVDMVAGVPVMDFSHGVLDVPLDEKALVEHVGMGGLPSAHVLRAADLAHLPIAEYPSNIDWNEDGILTVGPVRRDLNQNGEYDVQPLRDHDDWGKLVREGFDGIGLHAFRGQAPRRGPVDEFTCLPGDFNGDGMTDLFLMRGDRASLVLASGEGRLVTIPEAQRTGSIGSWKIEPVSALLVGDFLGLGRDLIFAHRDREVALLDCQENVPKLRWYEDQTIGAGASDELGGWSIGPADRFVVTRGVPGGTSTLYVTSGQKVAALSASSEGDSTLHLSWQGSQEILDVTMGQALSFRGGRILQQGEESLIVAGGDALLEILRSDGEPQLSSIDRGGRIPSAGADIGGTDGDWVVSTEDSLYRADLDADGTTEILIKNGEALGVVDWRDGKPWLVASVQGTLGEVWPMSSVDRIHPAQFIPGGPVEVLISNGQSWVLLVWDDAASKLRVLGIDNGYIGAPAHDPSPPESSPWELRKNQALLVGSFVRGEPEMALVQDTTSLLLARFDGDDFVQVRTIRDRVGDWMLDAEDRLLAVNLDADPELEILVRNGLLFGVIDLSTDPQCTFLGRLDADTLAFTREPQFRRGDSNADGDADISDVVNVLGSLFLGFQPPACDDAADVDDDGVVDVSDPIFLLAFLFNRGRIPPAPGPFTPGVDPTDDLLGCGAR